MNLTIDIDDPTTLLGHARSLLDEGHRLALIAAHDGPGQLRVVYTFVAGPPDRRVELHLSTPRAAPTVPSLASLSFPASRFEREMRDLFGVEPTDHPQPRPLVHHPHWPADWHPMRHDAGPRPPLDAAAPFPFVTVAGPGVYEIPVGPVHAGLIEPGHFRFSVVGETILKLKARLWFVHKGIEKLFEGQPAATALPLAERISGDTAVGHSLAYALAVESALRLPVPAAAQTIRAVLLELERLHNHVADLGMLCNDVAYGIANAHAQRIRERLLRLNQATTGHRLLRGGIFPGGAALLSVPAPRDILAVARDIGEIVAIALDHSVVRERFTGTAILGPDQAREIGTLGYVARASGLAYDARVAHPFADLGPRFTVPVQSTGDVLARFQQRAAEVEVSARVLDDLLPALSPGSYGTPLAASALATAGPAPNPASGPVAVASGVGIVEGWRGAIAHRVEIDSAGTLTRVKIVDPSFFNWPALPVSLANTIVPDFPLTNKSFNLSYAGNDL